MIVTTVMKLSWEFESGVKKVREKSRECHNHKPQLIPDTKRKRKQTKPNKHKSNKRTKSTTISSFFPKRGNRHAKNDWKTQEQTTTRQDLKQIARRINHNATKSKTPIIKTSSDNITF